VSIRVYKYGLLPPTENAALVRDQMRLAHRYRNTLVEIERGRRAAMREAERSYGDAVGLSADVDAAEESLHAVLEQLKAERVERGNKRDTPEIKATLAEARKTKVSAVAAWREYRRSVSEQPAMMAERDRINGLAAELRRSARAHCGVYWGTYLLIEAADDASRKMPLYEGADPNDPRFARWAGEGRVGVQLQGGLPIADLFGDDSRMRVDRVDDRAWHAESRGDRRRASRTALRLRVGSDGRAPVWASWPMTMHRPIPDGAVIKTAVVSLRLIGPREEWTVAITTGLPDDMRLRPSPPDGAVAIDLGWRGTVDGTRAVTWAATDGEIGSMALVPHTVRGPQKADELRGIRDANFNEARDALLKRLREMDNVPDWVALDLSRMGQWRSIDRLTRLVRRWRDRRWPGDEEAFASAKAWRYHDDHLWRWESSQRTKSLRHRRETYRILAATLAVKYRTVILDDFDLSEVARVPTASDDEKRDLPGARSIRQIVAPSELRLALQNAFAQVEIVDGAYMSRTCHACGSVESYDQASNIYHACRACRVVWDQDENAAINLLTRWRERRGDIEKAGVARKAKSANKWARVKEESKQRRERMMGPRNHDGNGT
jgi:hypothetical protein